MSDTRKEKHGMGLAEMLKGFSDYEEPSDYPAVDRAAYVHYEPYHIRMLKACIDGKATIEEVDAAYLEYYKDLFALRLPWYKRLWRWVMRLFRRPR